MAKSRIYAVTVRASEEERLIRGSSKAAILHFLADELFIVRPANADDVAGFMSNGVKVETCEATDANENQIGMQL